jgi:tetratricopeptide (TPR) repeat protein
MSADCRLNRFTSNPEGAPVPDHAHTHHHTPSPVHVLLEEAKAHIDAGRLEAAVSIYEHVVAQVPDNPDLHHTLGLVHLEAGRYDQAVHHIGRGLELNPSNAAAYRSMGDALGACQQYALAVRAYEKSCTLDPGNTDALLNLGNLYHGLDLFDRAEAIFEKMVTRTPGHMQGLNNLGKVNHDLGRLQRALVFYDRCLALYPGYAEAQFNRAALLLAMGDYQRGWEAYEWRFKRRSAANVYPHRLTTPRWHGDGYKNRRLLVHCEQGMGDMLQFVRYLPLVKQRGGTLLLEVHEPLVPLFNRQPWVDEVTAFNEKHPPAIPHDLHIPLLSLPNVLQTGSHTIPHAIPYIETNAQHPNHWTQHIKDDHLNIGLVWASSDINPKRNLPLEKCRAWFQNPKLHFISLQKGKAARQIIPLQSHAPPISVLGQHLHNFLDTARLMEGLDLIISVDTAPLHLAGGMGKPLWALLPFNADWRWPVGEEISPWYPHAEIFRQSSPGNWDDVIAAIGRDWGNRRCPSVHPERANCGSNPGRSILATPGLAGLD